MEALGQKIEKFDECEIELSKEEQLFFVNDTNEIVTYVNKNGVKVPVINNDDKRRACFEQFLAFHAKEIGIMQIKRNPEDVLYISFNGDREVLDSVREPEKYKSLLVFQTVEELRNDLTVSPFLNNEADVESLPPFTNILVRVNNFDEDTMLYISLHKVNLFELYNEIPLPWITKNRYGHYMVVHLSTFQKELFLDQGVDVDFYPINEGKSLEPLILDERKREAIIQKMVMKIGAYIRRETPDLLSEDNVVLITLKNGDRDLVRASMGTISYTCHEVVKKETLQDRSYFNQLQQILHPFVLVSKMADSDVVLYKAVGNIPD